MARCAFCGRDMLTAKGCRKITIRFVDGSRADPIKVGAPGDFYFGCEGLNDPVLSLRRLRRHGWWVSPPRLRLRTLPQVWWSAHFLRLSGRLSPPF